MTAAIRRVDVNADLGEYRTGAANETDAALLRVVTSASIACGGHAGDSDTMRRTALAAAECGVVIGAHPGYPDPEGFGRRNMAIEPAVLETELVRQINALRGICSAEGLSVRYVKPHGALYNAAVIDAGLAGLIARCVHRVDPALVLLAPGGSAMVAAAGQLGLRAASEAFADRAYLPDGRLAPRSDSGALIEDPGIAAARALMIVRDGKVTATDGSLVRIRAESICVHGDTPNAVGLAGSVRKALELGGFTVSPFAE